MDLACGTGYWLPSYARQCSRITLFDQSDRMLAESRAKADRLGVVDRCVFVHGDFFEQDFEKNAYDTFSAHRFSTEKRVGYGTCQRAG